MSEAAQFLKLFEAGGALAGLTAPARPGAANAGGGGASPFAALLAAAGLTTDDGIDPELLAEAGLDAGADGEIGQKIAGQPGDVSALALLMAGAAGRAGATAAENQGAPSSTPAVPGQAARPEAPPGLTVRLATPGAAKLAEKDIPAPGTPDNPSRPAGAGPLWLAATLAVSDVEANPETGPAVPAVQPTPQGLPVAADDEAAPGAAATGVDEAVTGEAIVDAPPAVAAANAATEDAEPAPDDLPVVIPAGADLPVARSAVDGDTAEGGTEDGDAETGNTPPQGTVATSLPGVAAQEGAEAGEVVTRDPSAAADDADGEAADAPQREAQVAAPAVPQPAPTAANATATGAGTTGLIAAAATVPVPAAVPAGAAATPGANPTQADAAVEAAAGQSAGRGPATTGPVTGAGDTQLAGSGAEGDGDGGANAGTHGADPAEAALRRLAARAALAAAHQQTAQPARPPGGEIGERPGPSSALLQATSEQPVFASPPEMAQSVVRVALQPTGALALPVRTIAVHMAQHFANGTHEFRIKLDPPELGRIDVRMEIARDGQLTAQLTADRPDTLDALMRDARTLERALQSAGLDLDDGALNFNLREGSGDGMHDGEAGADGKTPDAGTEDEEPAERRAVSLNALDISV